MVSTASTERMRKMLRRKRPPQCKRWVLRYFRVLSMRVILSRFRRRFSNHDIIHKQSKLERKSVRAESNP